jgi:hypothetical protein
MIRYLSFAVERLFRLNGLRLRKLLSILLLAFLGLPLASPLFAMGTDADAGVPACCRRDGKHRCHLEVKRNAQSPEEGLKLSALPERCPYSPSMVANGHTNPVAGVASASIFASVVSHPTGQAQAESKRRISRGSSRQKRGPPTLILL